MVWKVYFVSIGVMVSYFRTFHHVTLAVFDVYLHAWLYVYNMERRGVRFDHIFDEIDACLVWLRVLGTKLIFSKLIFADYPFTVKSLTDSVFYRVLKVSTYVRRYTMLPKQCVYRPKSWLGTNTVSAKTVFVPSPIFHGKQRLRVLYTYSPSRDRPCFYD